MGTVTTSGYANPTAYAAQRQLVRTSNDVLWALIPDSTTFAASYSTDGGATWSAATGFAGQSGTVTYPAVVSTKIDEDDCWHVAYRDAVNGYIYYTRGVPNAARTAMTWGTPYLVYNANSNADAPDLVAHRDPAGGGGWFAHLVFGRSSGPVHYARLTVSSAGAVAAVGGLVTLSSSAGTQCYPSVDFTHTGDGKTVAGGQPDLHVGWTAGQAGAGYGIRYRKATYSGGGWTWNTEREIDSTRYVGPAGTWLNLAWDGSRVLLGGDLATSASATGQVLHERDAADATTTLRTLIDPDADATRVYYGSLTYDSGSVYLLGRRINGGQNLRCYRRWNRADGSHAVVDIGPAAAAAPYMSAVRGGATALDYVYNAGGSGPYTVASGKVAGAPSTQLTNPPAGAGRDFTKAQTFEWQVTAGDRSTLDGLAYAFRRNDGTTTQWWTGSAWTTTETWVTSSSTSIAFAAGTWSNGTVYTWSVASRAAEATGAYATAQQVTGRADPTTTWTQPASDGTSVANTGPILTFTGTPGSGASLTGSSIIVMTAAEYTANGTSGRPSYTGTSLSGFTGTWDLPGGTLPAGNYVGLARSRQTLDQWGPYSARTFTVAPPTVPTPTASATAITSPGVPRVEVAVSWTRGSTTGTVSLTAQRSTDGTTWTTVDTLQGGSTGNTSGTIVDLYAPTSQATQYRVRADTVNGDEAGQSPWSSTTTATLTVPRETLWQVGGSTVASMRLASASRSKRPWSGDVVYPLDSDTPVVISGVPSRPEGEALAACVTWAEGEALEAMLLGTAGLLWRRPPTSDGVARRDQVVRVKPGSVTLRQFADDRVRWAACVVEWSWTEVG